MKYSINQMKVIAGVFICYPLFAYGINKLGNYMTEYSNEKGQIERAVSSLERIATEEEKQTEIMEGRK